MKTKATIKTKTKVKAKTNSAKAAKAKAKKKAPTSDELMTLVDRHGQECGFILYSPYFEQKVILSLNEEAPRSVTLGTWKRWGKQAAEYQKVMKKRELEWSLKASVLKYPKSKSKAKKKGK